MKYLKFIRFISVFLLIVSANAYAVLESSITNGDAFARGNWVEVGVDENGYFGSDETRPTGYHDSRVGGLFGFISNPLETANWTEYDGDFFTPGSPAEGFGFSIDGVERHNNGGIGAIGIPGSITGVDTGTLAEFDVANIYWTGNQDGLRVDRTITVSESSFFILMTTTLTNTSGATLNNVFWSHEVDPDNNRQLNLTYDTENTVLNQPGAFGGQPDLNDRAIVLAHQDDMGANDTDGSDLYLIAVDPRARVIRKTSGLTVRDADGTYNGTAANSIQTVGTTSTDDAAIAIGFNLGDIAAGESVTFRYAYNPASDNTDILDLFSLSTDYGDAPDTYGTTEASGSPAKHQYVSGLFLGTRPSGDGDGFVDGVDDSGDASDDSDDDGVSAFPALETNDTSYTLSVDATNLTNLNDDGGEDASIIGWIDFDGNGTFESDEASTLSSIATGNNNTSVNLTWSNIGTANDINFGTTYVRIRVASDSEGIGITSFNAAFDSGEVEDYEISIDSSEPEAVSISSGAGFLNIADSSVLRTISGISSGVDGQTLTLDVQGVSLASEPYTVVVSAGGAWSIDIPALDVAALNDATTYTLEASVSAVTDSDSLIVDLTAPAAPTVFPSSGNTKTFAELQPTIVGTTSIAAGQSLKVSIDGETFFVSPDGAGNWELDLTTAVSILSNTVTLTDSTTYEVVATAVDQAGNSSNDASSNEVVIDSSQVLIDINVVSGDDKINEDEVASTLTVTGDTTLVTAGDTVTLTVEDDGGSTVHTDTTTVAANGTWSLNILTAELLTWADEIHTFIVGTPAASADASRLVLVDTLDPSVTLSGIPSAINSTSPFPVTFIFDEDVFNFSQSDVSLTNATIQSGSWSKTNNKTYVATIVPSSGADVTVSVPASAANDASGNGNTLASSTVTWDVTAPTVSINAIPSATSANELSYPVSGSCTNGDGVVTVTITGVTPQTPSCSGGTWGPINFNVSSVSAGLNTIIVNASQTDAATNQGNATQRTAHKVGAPAAVNFIQEPSNAVAGVALAPTMTAEIVDAFGNRVDVTTEGVLSIASGSGALDGDIDVNAVGGLITFPSIDIDEAGVFTLDVDVSGLTGDTSSSFTISPAAAADVAFVQEPSNAAAGADFAPTVTAEIVDAFGNRVNSSANVVLAIASGTGSLDGTSTVAASNGLATFSNMNIDEAGNFTLSAASTGLTTDTSASFTISAGAATNVNFIQEPTNATAGVDFTPTITAEIVDAFGNRVNVTTEGVLSINSGTGSLDGDIDVNAVGGLITFPNIDIDEAGAFTLDIDVSGLTADTSAGFTISASSSGRYKFCSRAN